MIAGILEGVVRKAEAGGDPNIWEDMDLWQLGHRPCFGGTFDERLVYWWRFWIADVVGVTVRIVSEEYFP